MTLSQPTCSPRSRGVGGVVGRGGDDDDGKAGRNDTAARHRMADAARERTVGMSHARRNYSSNSTATCFVISLRLFSNSTRT